MSDFNRAEFEQFIRGLRLRYFEPHEFLVHCERPLNTYPPRELWPNMAATARVIDTLRSDIARPVSITSAYRSTAYNDSLPGAATYSQHLRFCAVDIQARGLSTWQVFKRLRDMRNAGFFRGGMGLYRTFVHIDTRGHNATWGSGA